MLAEELLGAGHQAAAGLVAASARPAALDAVHDLIIRFDHLIEYCCSEDGYAPLRSNLPAACRPGGALA